MRRVGMFLARRVTGGVLTIVVVVTLTFLMYWALSPQPGRFIYPLGIKTTSYQLSDGAHRLGADRPKLTQYGDWWWHLLHGDFGHMWTGATLSDNVVTTAPIGPTLYPAIRVTLSILIGGAIMTVLLAIPLGVLSGRRVGSIPDKVIAVGALVGVCTHPIVTGKLLTQWFGIDLHWLPVGGYCTFVEHPPPAGLNLPPNVHLCGGPVDWTTHMILPWVTFAFLFLALYTRMIRASVAESIHEDYVRTARSKGARERRVLLRHVLPNASLRVLTMVGMDIGTALGVAVFVEFSYGFFGLARLSILAMTGDPLASATDLPMLLAVVTVIALIVVVGNLLVDLLYSVVDPRTGTAARSGQTKEIAAGVM
ncbi:MAG TPA: ABC transporter permease [Gaiellaceae bacterium]|nr:ABC transporter permease [Gaiellaceae bacterium]